MTEETPDYLKMMKKDIEKQFKITLTDGSDFLNKEQTVIPLSPALDLITGGVLTGSFISISGPPKAGKSLSSLSIAATFQKPEHGSRHVYYLNIESRLRRRDILGIEGLDENKFTIIQSKPGNILTGENYLAIAEHLIKSHPGCLIIIDSAGAICTNAEQIASMSEMQRADGPKLLAKFCRKVSNVLPTNDVTIICILHLMSNVTGYGRNWLEKSGNAIKYITDTKLRIKKFTFLESDGKPVGQELNWICECSPLSPPGREIISTIRYGVGIDYKYETMKIGMDCGILKLSGSWITSTLLNEYSKNDKDFTIQGKDNLYKFLLDHPKAYDLVNDKIKEMLG